MNVNEALQLIKEEKSIIIGDTTFKPEKVDAVTLPSGEKVYWIRDGGDVWLALDVSSEEVILFSDVGEEVDASSDVAVYAGDDYEFSYEDTGKMEENGEIMESVSWREFEKNDGTVLRVTEYEVGGETLVAVGNKISEDELQEV